MSNLYVTPAERPGFHSREADVVPLKDRLQGVESGDQPDPAQLTEMWVQKIHWDIQRGLLLGEDEETTGVVKLELPEL